MKFHAHHSRWFAYLLHLLLPGLGHTLWRETLFGLFVFLIMLIAAALFFLTFFVPFSWTAKLLLFGMPVVFYVFSFFDLARSIRARKRGVPGPKRGIIMLAVGLVFFLAAPIAPGNFLLRNLPALHTIDRGTVAPVFSEGDLTLVNPLAYSVNLFFLSRPVVYELPERFDVVRVRVDGRGLDGFVFGLPHEMLEVTNGRLIVNGVPMLEISPVRLTSGAHWPLTSAGNRSILVATIRNGMIDAVYHVGLENVHGEITRIL
ncbi:hypothetical protein GF420_16355 [candidate division GN15 bacterium]|nr:hypothetical protein [candidate division GN15 bacterium]